MTKFVIRRIGSAALVVVLLIGVVFALQEASPVDPVRLKVGPTATRTVVEAERERLGYNDALPVRYVRYIVDLSHGDLQTSLRTRRPVATDLGKFMPASIELAMYAIGVAALMGLFLGMASGARLKGSGSLRFVMTIFASAPAFLLAVLGVLLFYRRLGWLPASGRSSVVSPPNGPTGLVTIDGLLAGRPNVAIDAFKHLILPVLSLAIGPAVAIGRVLRGSISDTLASDQARTGRSKGLAERRIVTRHGLRNAAGSSLAMFGLQVGMIFSALVVVETVFSWPGIGLYTAQSIPSGDFPAIAGVTIVFGIGYVVVNATVDFLQALADPRIRT